MCPAVTSDHNTRTDQRWRSAVADDGTTFQPTRWGVPFIIAMCIASGHGQRTHMHHRHKIPTQMWWTPTDVSDILTSSHSNYEWNRSLRSIKWPLCQVATTSTPDQQWAEFFFLARWMIAPLEFDYCTNLTTYNSEKYSEYIIEDTCDCT